MVTPDRTDVWPLLRVDGGPLTLAHEGDTVAAHPDQTAAMPVELSAKGLSFTLQSTVSTRRPSALVAAEPALPCGSGKKKTK